MIETLKSLQELTLKHLPTLNSEEDLLDYKNSILGKAGSLTVILKGLKDLSGEERSAVGKLANEVRDILSESFEAEKNRIYKEQIAKKLESEKEDVTIPFHLEHGSLHPITKVQQEVEDAFTRMGFDIYESMDLTTEYLNFDAVNVPKNHPARDMQDTFWLEGT
jgi:phenylalanyl-tRNA synthetase alpha chain